MQAAFVNLLPQETARQKPGVNFLVSPLLGTPILSDSCVMFASGYHCCLVNHVQANLLLALRPFILGCILEEYFCCPLLLHPCKSPSSPQLCFPGARVALPPGLPFFHSPPLAVFAL